MTPLMFAVPHSSPQVIKTLLDAGAKVNETDVRGMTPLMLAVSSDTQDAEVVKLLIEAKADVNRKSGAGETALDWAVKFNDPAGLAALRAAGAPTAAAYSGPLRKASD